MERLQRFLKAWFRFSAGALVVLAVGLVALYFAGRYEPLLGVRDTLFTRAIPPKMWDLSPTELRQKGFRWEKPEKIAAFRAELEAVPEYAKKIEEFRAEPDVVVRAKEIVRFMGVGGAQGVRTIHRLRPKLDAVRTGYGDCGDHSEAFLAWGLASDLQVREVLTSLHGIAEFWHPSKRHWIYIDPMYAVMARGEDGEYLSLYEIRERRMKKQPIRWEFFGKAEGQLHSESDPMFRYYYENPAAFERLAMTGGNNVISMDESNLGPGVPLPAEQFVEFADGTRPGYWRVADSYDTASRWIEPAKIGMLVLLAVVIGGLGAGPASWLVGLARRSS